MAKNFVLHITNTFVGKKEEFMPQDPGQVTMYVCGITPYDFPHLGHGRVYVTFDVLYRLLKFLGYDVRYCRNFTDIDDKLLNRAQEEFGDPLRYQEIAQRYIAAFHKNMEQLNCLPPTYEPYVTKTIPEIISFIEGLIKANKAYVVDGDVYYHVRSFPSYGKLSKRNLEDLKIGARVEVDERKQDPLDFAVWKSSEDKTLLRSSASEVGHVRRSLGGVGWQSPWGYGRPGWHIECSAMASNYLGNHIDLHAGGMDLIFPHHENEIAQSEGLHGAPFARYWMHNAFVRINKEKMSKSLGNFFTLNQIFESFDPMVVRFYILNHNYTSPLDFSFDELERIQKTYQRLCKMLEPFQGTDISKEQIMETPIGYRMLSFLCDDLNTVGALGVVFERETEIEHNRISGNVVKAILQQIMGLVLQPLPEKKVEITPKIQQLFNEREAARAAKDWAKADALREKLKELGVDVQDTKVGSK